jgi:hypothetical protein
VRMTRRRRHARSRGPSRPRSRRAGTDRPAVRLPIWRQQVILAARSATRRPRRGGSLGAARGALRCRRRTVCGSRQHDRFLTLTAVAFVICVRRGCVRDVLGRSPPRVAVNPSCACGLRDVWIPHRFSAVHWIDLRSTGDIDVEPIRNAPGATQEFTLNSAAGRTGQPREP